MLVVYLCACQNASLENVSEINISEMEKRADTADISVLFFFGCANFFGCIRVN